MSVDSLTSMASSMHQSDEDFDMFMTKPTFQSLPRVILEIIIKCLHLIDMHQFFLCSKFTQSFVKNQLLLKEILLRNYSDPPKSTDKSNKCQDGHFFCAIDEMAYIYHFWKQYLFGHGVVFSNKQFVEMYSNLKLASKTRRKFTLYKTNWKIFHQTTIHQTLCRILSFKFWSKQPLFDVHQHKLQNRTLNFYEQNLFQCIKITNFITHYKIQALKVEHNPVIGFATDISDIGDFVRNFERMYLFSRWVNFIDWDCFCVAGSSVVSALLNKDWTQQDSHDVNIFAHSISLKEFQMKVTNIHYHFGNFKYEYVNKPTIKTFKIQMSHSVIILQFIWQCKIFQVNNILGNFDLDICQSAFLPNELKVVGTGAFIECIKTGCFMSYPLISEKRILRITTIKRIKKYINKGFRFLLIPKAMDSSLLESGLNEKQVYTPNNTSNIEYLFHELALMNISFDFFDVQRKFVSLLGFEAL